MGDLNYLSIQCGILALTTKEVGSNEFFYLLDVDLEKSVSVFEGNSAKTFADLLTHKLNKSKYFKPLAKRTSSSLANKLLRNYIQKYKYYYLKYSLKAKGPYIKPPLEKELNSLALEVLYVIACI